MEGHSVQIQSMTLLNLETDLEQCQRGLEILKIETWLKRRRYNSLVSSQRLMEKAFKTNSRILEITACLLYKPASN